MSSSLLDGAPAPADFAARLKWIRETAKLTAREVDRRAGITEGHTNAIESRRIVRVTVPIAEQIGGVFGRFGAWLLTGGKQPSQKAVRAAVRAAAEG